MKFSLALIHWKQNAKTLFFSLNCVVALGLLFSGCTPARMAVRPQLLSESREMKVEGRKSFSFNESFSFGPYQVTNVQRGWTKSSGWSVLYKKTRFESRKAKQEYEFLMRDTDAKVWKAQCLVGANEEILDIFPSKNIQLGLGPLADVSFVCFFQEQGQSNIWRLALGVYQDTGGLLKGLLSDGSVQIRVSGTRKLANTPIPLSDPTGYEFFTETRVIASVEVINKGAVWIHLKATPEMRPVLATASAALLLYQDIRKRR